MRPLSAVLLRGFLSIVLLSPVFAAQQFRKPARDVSWTQPAAPGRAQGGGAPSRELLSVSNGVILAHDIAKHESRPVSGSQLLDSREIRELLDWTNLSTRKRRLLVTVHDSRGLRDDQGSFGAALWQIDTDGVDRYVSDDVFQARLSPDGESLLYVTTSRNVTVQSHDGRNLLSLARGYSPKWSPDGRSLVLSRAGDGSDPDTPETLSVATVDIKTGVVRELTDGAFDDVRPEFDPSGEWVLFVSGGRTGIASFWQVPATGGVAAQVTNIGATTVDHRFVPTPFKTTIWSADGKWFVYDFKLAEREEVWGLQFDTDGHFVRALKLSHGHTPQWLDNGVSLVVHSRSHSEPTMAVVELP